MRLLCNLIKRPPYTYIYNRYFKRPFLELIIILYGVYLKGWFFGTPYPSLWNYNIFKAFLIIPSTGRLGSSFTICITTFCVGTGEKPNTAKACTASSTKGEAATALLLVPPSLLVAPIKLVILSFSSTMMRCAALGPIPYTLFNDRASSVWTILAKSAGVKAESIMRAVCPPTPDTLSSNANKSRSMRVANPKSR